MGVGLARQLPGLGLVAGVTFGLSPGEGAIRPLVDVRLAARGRRRGFVTAPASASPALIDRTPDRDQNPGPESESVNRLTPTGNIVLRACSLDPPVGSTVPAPTPDVTGTIRWLVPPYLTG
jgi:hypothetical protein